MHDATTVFELRPEVFDRGEARGTLRMLSSHIVLQAVGMGDECNAHAGESRAGKMVNPRLILLCILAHRVQSPHVSRGEIRSENVLLKAEFTPRAAGSSPIHRVIAAASQIILGKEAQLRLALGHDAGI